MMNQETSNSNQVLLPKHPVTELLDSLHRKAGGHPGITKMIQEIRCKYYYHGTAKLPKIGKWMRNMHQRQEN